MLIKQADDYSDVLRALEQKAESLKLLKASMPPAQYAAELEEVLTDLARKTQEIRALEGVKK